MPASPRGYSGVSPCRCGRSAATIEQLRVLLAEPSAQTLAERMAFFAGHGVEPIEEMRASLGSKGYRDSVDGVPQATRLMVDNDLTPLVRANGAGWKPAVMRTGICACIPRSRSRC